MRSRSFWFGVMAAALIALQAVCCFSEVPRAVINGPTTGQAGEILILDAGESEGTPTHFSWDVSPKIAGRKMFEPECGDKSRIRISSFPGIYKYTLIVSNADGNDVLYWDVAIPGNTPAPVPPPGPNPAPNPEPGPMPPEPPPDPGPAPGPNPSPNPQPAPPKPEPDPVVPDGQFGIAKQIVDWSETVTSPTKLQDAKGFAGSFEAVASAIAAGSLRDADKIVQALLAANRSNVGQQVIQEHWMTLAQNLNAHLAATSFAGKLKNSDQWSAYLRECAAGFKAIR